MDAVNTTGNANNAPHDRCTVCGSRRLEEIYEAAAVPVFVNILWPDYDRAVACPKENIRLVLCLECCFIFNTSFNPDLLEYGEGYENTLHYSPRFREYAEMLAGRLIERYRLHGKRIVEIGCGKGDFLLMLCALGGNSGIGFDASYEERFDAEGVDVRFIRDHFSAEYAPLAADLVCSRQVLEHVPDPKAFLRLIGSAVEERDTPCFFEVPNVLYTIRNRFIWDVIYEHYAYFTPASLSYLFSAGGFEVREISEEFGGQYLTAHVAPSRGKGAASPPREEIEPLIREVLAFRDDYRCMIDSWHALIEREASGRRVVLWGAGSKGVTFANLLDLGGKISYIVDISPKKEGSYVAGSGQKIVPPHFLTAYKPDLVIVMNAIYEKEIREIVRKMGIDPRIICV
jgi:SAM-dependent methyltransferase